MPLVSPFRRDPLVDGRQSERAMLVRRGVQRLMIQMRVSVLPEIPLVSGRRADLLCLSEKGEFSIVEIKSSIEDFRVDRKWPEYRLHCDRLYFATHPGVPLDIFPEDCGLILSDGYGAEILREAPEEKLASATRKALTLRFARLSADRLLQAEWVANPYLTGGDGE
ncbi:MmcB family DNA repair protein [Aureimonas sp. ME7]|uniref:MmcB family DNA repair protein n=1 Tax=Aureimonas sp. ME7 TaxID=2744252 RepID=UPI0015F45B36|nr:MmcB family DNA repair protein [Aureimonas sp. ME7]